MWLEFAAMTMNPLAGKQEIDDTETAFKAGAAAVLLEQCNVWSLLPDDEAVAMLRSWTRETQEHFAKYRKYAEPNRYD
jgi:pyruvate kinase